MERLDSERDAEPSTSTVSIATSSPLSSISSSQSLSPLSTLSKTPSLPSSPVMSTNPARDYPSPMSTETSGTQSPIKLGEPILEADLNEPYSGPPPKRRKTATPKERTTEYLDLTQPDDHFSQDDTRQMNRLVAELRKKKKIVVVAGAGISVSAGIPDFRSSTGLFSTARNQHKLKASGKHLFDASVYRHDSSTQSFHTMVREMAQMTKNARPTPFHHLLASLAQEGRLLRLYSQNIDCIDTSMQPLATNVPLNPKGPWPATIQLHGGLEKMVCTKCGQLRPCQAELFDGPEAPLCEACIEQDLVRTEHAGKRSHGIGRLRPRFVLYNEFNPDEEAIGNVSSADLKARPDAVIVVGTTLKVPGTRRLVKELCQVTRGRRDGFTAWINIDSEPKGVEFKDCWDLVIRSKCDDVARLVALPPWDTEIGEDYLVSLEEDLEHRERRSQSTFEVSLVSQPSSDLEPHVEAKPRQVEEVQGIPTPRASPTLPSTQQTGKTKQSKISFTGVKGIADGKPVKTSKPRVRKPKQAPKPKPVKNTLTQNFKSTKNGMDRNTKPDANSGTVVTKNVLLQENLDVLQGLPPLRPKREFPSEDRRPSLESSATPTTPTLPERRPSTGTISPPSIPKNMKALIHSADTN